MFIFRAKIFDFLTYQKKIAQGFCLARRPKNNQQVLTFFT
jgi:hypothetical protein